ncbi:MAG: biotin carboxylase N-terminal domain-containing protein, partial [Zavarzinia sp.]|nr:biotin carboxylase N-terminal domain-containing protein [Zavarzinia sp.]
MFTRILIANRGEIAIRIARACAALGIESVAVHGADDARSLHVGLADRAVALPGRGVGAYLDRAAVIAAAKAEGCDAIHPGYGFLAENPVFAADCAAAGIIFIGPSPETLALFGDKIAARRLAEDAGVPVVEGTARAVEVSCAEAFMRKLGPGARVMVKAAAGGGGRGMRVVERVEDMAEAFVRCASEAQSAFGDGTLFVERYIPTARHVEVQVLGDGEGTVTHLFERDCSLQRRHQKLVEMAPAPGLSDAMRLKLYDAALALARAVRYRTIGTVEFLVAPDESGFWFMEANPRLQVEHAVTEAVTGIDLAAVQIRLAAGDSLAALDLAGVRPRGFAIEARINLEAMDGAGNARPAAGTIATYEMPGGPGIRVDGAGYAGLAVDPGFDPM